MRKDNELNYNQLNHNEPNNNEGALRILEALSAVDGELLERCDTSEEVATIPLWRQWRMWAACLSFIAVGVLSWNALRFIGSSKGSMDSADENAAMDMAALQEAATEEQLNGASAAGAAEKTELETDSGIDSTARGYVEDKLKDMDQSLMETAPPESLYSESASGVTQDLGCPKDAAKEVTEEEARNWLPFGAKIPQNLPSGYVFESARINEQEQYVTVCWSRGMDSIMITVSQVEADAIDTVDTSKPETYDERLYEIPYGETVPIEYFQIFQDPVFDIKDMTHDTGLELIRSRMISYQDAGDTDTPRGTFSILYSDGMLLRFNGRGTPEEIWNMLYSMVR